MKKIKESKKIRRKDYLNQKGITLIALVVTIVVLLILAGVSISALFGDNGIINKAKEAQSTMDNAQENDKISLILAEWKIEEATEQTTFEKFMKEKFGEDKVETVTANEVIVTMESGNRYKVKTDGTIVNTKGVSISKSSLILEIQEGATVTETLTASLSDITGEISWSNSDNTKATISTTKGESITVTSGAVGTTTITAKCGDYTATCKVIVREAIEVGSYVQYDLPYIDMYSGTEYTATNGWRYLGSDDEGNQLIISTTMPAILYFDYKSNIGNTVDGGANSWWATKAEVSATTDTLYQTTKGYDEAQGKYAAYGLRYKFDKIPFTYQESGITASTANAGIFKKVGNTISGENISLNFKADGVNIIDVHNLTLTELNRAVNKATGTTRADTDTSVGFQDLTETALGLFDMWDLPGYSGSNWSYWFACPGIIKGNIYETYVIAYSALSQPNGLGGNIVGSFVWPSEVGVRPVVTLPADVNLTVISGN